MGEGNHAVNVSAATINQSNEVTSFLQIVPVSIQSGGNRLNTYAFLDSRSTVSFIDQSVQEKLRGPRHRCDAQHSWHTRNEGSEDRKSSSQNKGTTFKGAFNRSVCTPVNLLGKHKLQQAEAKLPPLECFTQQKLQLDGSWHHPWSRCL